MNPDDILNPLLVATINGGALRELFRLVFPTGSAIDVPIERYAYTAGPFSATLCPAGCGARVVIRDVALSTLATTARPPFRIALALSLTVTSRVGGARGALPIVTSLGDLAVDVDTARGASDLRFGTTVVLGSPTTPAGFVRVGPAFIPEALQALGVTVDIGEVVPLPGGDIELDDLDVRGTSSGGRVLASAINTVKSDLVARLRAEARYAINTAVCQRLGTTCPPRPQPILPPIVRMPASLPWVASVGLTALLLWAAYRKPSISMNGLGAMSDDERRAEKRRSDARYLEEQAQRILLNPYSSEQKLSEATKMLRKAERLRNHGGLGACPSCGGASHPATGSVTPSGQVVCGPCVRRFWSWASEHGKKSYRVGPKGKKAKYIPFPTGITKR